ncbi:MAG: tRNA (N(6)-L-threonylcarbamoyladenosine(37)-C(2))-methylthiotransferase MtaB, partial [Candidatus Atribacteria bacterium]|nr:tRNA (N(6)-L-threonylcarbamoyladenosine(37)-C(2))-methylthiotransferase MtaB [Candidatus Atribacteria bacterium]
MRKDYFIIKVAFKTLGCKVNQYETEVIFNLFQTAGYRIINFKEKADIYIINTCTVTKEADRKSKQMVRKAIRQNQNAKIIVTGCYAQSNYQDLKKIEGISLIAGNREKNIILQQIDKLNINHTIIKVKPVKYLRKFDNIFKGEISLHTRAWVKIQDGCNKFCSYCKVPYARGPARSRLIEDILKEISNLNSRGVKEVVLLGINLGTYGKDMFDKKVSLSKLISLISNFEEIKRIRLSSIELDDINDELMDVFIKCPKLCHHLHIPLQSGDDKILKLMNRPYTTSVFKNKISQIMRKIPDIAITTDIMVGFPREDVQSFNNTYNFVKKIGFAKIHIFPYSDREKCLATSFPDKVDQKIKKDRRNKLLNLSKELSCNFQKK